MPAAIAGAGVPAVARGHSRGSWLARRVLLSITMKDRLRTMPGIGTERTLAAAREVAATIAPDVEMSEDMLPAHAALRPLAHGFTRGDSIGRFLVLHLLGAGGMGAVFAAYDPQLDRQVAIKVVHPGLSASETTGAVRSRLLREAQAMAKLSHPSVITVYEVGAVGDDIYVAMELVDGGTLAAWLEEARADERPWREIVAKVVQAGRGLAAAHRAELVHRDFKPDNVLVGSGGIVRVTDFGLVGSTTAPADAPLAPQRPPSSPSIDQGSITRTGAVMGTPAYMAPEQHRGERVDERADQFAFCVTLYEALTGERPFAGATYGELMANTCGGHVRPFAKTSHVPAWIRAALLRGLSLDPDARFASMDELLAVLEHDPRRRTRQIAVTAGATTAMIGAFALTLAMRNTATAEAEPPCRASRARLVQVWDDSVKATIRHAFAAASGSRGDASYQRVAAALDGYTDRWVAGHTDACTATVVRHEQSEHLLDLRNRCLDRRRTELAALSALFVAADREVVAKAPQASYALTAPERCGDVDALDAALPPPERPEVAIEVNELRLRLAAATARQAAGKWRDGLALAEILVADARKVDYPPVLAEALFLAGTLRRDLKDGRGAEVALLEVTTVAAKAKDDLLLARTWPELIFVVGYLQGKPADGLAFERPARSMLERIGANEPRLTARLENTVGLAHTKAGRTALARTHQERALALQETALGRDHPDVGMSLNNLGLLAKDEGRFADAIALYDRAIAIRERALGPDHPFLATVLQNRAAVSPVLESIALNERVLAMQTRVLGANAQEVGVTLSNQSVNYGQLGDHRRELELAESALRIKLATSGPDNPSTGYTQLNIGDALMNLDRCREAFPHLRRTIEIFEQAGADQINVIKAERAWSQCEQRAGRRIEARAHVAHAVAVGEKLGDRSIGLAEALMARGALALGEHSYDDALRDYHRALAIREQVAGADAIDTARSLQAIAEVQLARGNPGGAAPILERALAIQRSGEPLEVAWCAARLAKVLWQTDRSVRPRARELAETARAIYAGLAPRAGAELADVTGWLAAHAGR
ncbi:MAG: serine/threonine-protein kinase [Kofleriaceae bacterium]